MPAEGRGLGSRGTRKGGRDRGDWRKPTSPVLGSEIPDGVACVMLSAELFGVGRQGPCRATLSADLTPHKSCMGPARGDATRQGSQAEPLPG